MPLRPDIQAMQDALDELGRRQRWTRGRFSTWKVRGFTVAVGARGTPRKYIAARGARQMEFADLAELCRTLGIRKVSR